MIYFLHGSNNKEARKKLKSLSEALHSKRPEAEVFRIHNENWSDSQFDELLVAQGLFDQKYIVILDSLFDDKEIKETIVDRAKEMKESENVFLILDGDVDKKTLDKISKYADKVQEFNGDTKKVEKFNTFSLADSFGRRDKKNLWIGYLQAIDLGISPEEISGVLFWQIKSIMLVMKTKNVKESGLSPFVYTKANGFARNFTLDEISEYAHDLVEATQAVRQGEGEMEVLLERIVLKI
jgi:DNA polymerase III delta subunit